MAEKQLDDLFLDTLKDIYYAERQILKALPKMAKAAMSPELKAGFEQHHAETEVQVEIQAVRVGDFAIAAAPGELFVELGLAIKRQSPFATTLVNELANGSAIGYVCTRDAFVQGGYEPRLTMESRLPPEMGELCVDRAVTLLREFK